ncbi:MAG: hypothetical protein PVG07_05785 [Acidobacteriota bacterium]|jgi:hypothetical protein
MDAPVLGAFDELTQSERKWRVSLSWRYQKSDRHFRGTEEEEHRQFEDSEVINTIHLAEIGIRYDFDLRNSLTVTIPYLLAERSHPIRDENRDVVGRSVLNSRGLSDVTLVGRRLLWDPAKRPKGNLSLGLGVKLPTGANNVVDTRERLGDDGEPVYSVETVDQSVQPGDGGFGVIVDMSGFRQLGSRGDLAAYASGAYLINPEGTSGVQTYRSRDGEQIMSIADQYVFRTGLLASPASWNGIAVGLGGRIEGVPVHDLFGSSEGFRRPGYAISVEPSVSWTRGPHSLSLAVPIAVQRNRQRSVPDLANDHHGDAAFADYVVLMGYWRRF